MPVSELMYTNTKTVGLLVRTRPLGHLQTATLGFVRRQFEVVHGQPTSYPFSANHTRASRQSQTAPPPHIY